MKRSLIYSNFKIGGEDGTYKYSKTTTKGNDRAGWNEVDNKWNNEQVKNREKTTNDVRLSERNEGYSTEQWNDNTKVDRYKRDGGLEESSSFIEGGLYNEIGETIKQNDSGRKKTIFEKSRWKKLNK